MIYYKVLNHMDKDELRNYIGHLIELNERYLRYINILTSALEKYSDLLRINNEVYRCDSESASKRKKVYALENEISEKYKDYIQKPMNTCATMEGEA